LKEICHKGLARLVGEYGSSLIEPNALELVVNASVEPDNIDRERFSENFFYGIKYLFNHTIKAKKLSVNYIRKTRDAYAMNSSSWLKNLGIVFHFITDWGTPYHSPTSKSNPFLDITQAGVQLGGEVGIMSKSSSSWRDELWEFVKGALIGGGIFGAIGLILLYFSHNNFESRCDERWKESLSLIREHFRAKLVHSQLPKKINLAFDLFEEKMNKLHQRSEDLPADWIDNCTDVEYADYMSDIAIIMDLACQIVMIHKPF